MKGYLLVSHGTYATALKESLEMITGELGNVYAVGLKHSDGPETFLSKIEEEVSKMKLYNQIIVMTDLLGGSPGNTAVTHFMNFSNVSIISGMNFPMLLSAVMDDNASLEEVIQLSKEGIVDVKAFVQANMEEIDD